MPWIWWNLFFYPLYNHDYHDLSSHISINSLYYSCCNFIRFKYYKMVLIFVQKFTAFNNLTSKEFCYPNLNHLHWATFCLRTFDNYVTVSEWKGWANPVCKTVTKFLRNEWLARFWQNLKLFYYFNLYFLKCRENICL